MQITIHMKLSISKVLTWNNDLTLWGQQNDKILYPWVYRKLWSIHPWKMVSLYRYFNLDMNSSGIRPLAVLQVTPTASSNYHHPSPTFRVWSVCVKYSTMCVDYFSLYHWSRTLRVRRHLLSVKKILCNILPMSPSNVGWSQVVVEVSKFDIERQDPPTLVRYMTLTIQVQSFITSPFRHRYVIHIQPYEV